MKRCHAYESLNTHNPPGAKAHPYPTWSEGKQGSAERAAGVPGLLGERSREGESAAHRDPVRENLGHGYIYAEKRLVQTWVGDDPAATALSAYNGQLSFPLYNGASTRSM